MGTSVTEETAFLRPESIREASAILSERDAVIISGGQSLMPLFRQGMINTDAIVDISHIDDHNEVVIDDDAARIGGLVTHRELTESELVESPWRALAETAELIGDKQVRNWGTVGGSVAHADPTLDYPPTMTVFDSIVEVQAGDSREEVPIDELYLAPFTTTLEPHHIVIGVRVPRPPEHTGVSFQKFAWRKGDQAVVNVAARITADETGEITESRLCIGSVVPHPTRPGPLEESLLGQKLDDTDVQEEVAEGVEEYIEPIAEAHASEAYQTRLTQNLTLKALRKASERARESLQ